MIDLVRGESVSEIRPLLEEYAQTLPDDPNLTSQDEFLSLLAQISKFRGLVLVAKDGDTPIGFCWTEIFRDDTLSCLCALVNTAFIRKPYRARGLLSRALKVIEAWAEEAGVAYIGCLAANGGALARLTGWTYAGTWQGKDYLLHPIAQVTHRGH
jgi:GNAT superfamily N-acetyltransferase